MQHSQQYHINGPSQGFVPVRTARAIDPKWSLEVGLVAYGSPVIGEDGTIYVGTLKGELVAVWPDGNIRWKQDFRALGYPSMITGSPAVGLDGNIYVITTINIISRDHREEDPQDRRILRSRLHSVSPQGNVRWTYQFPTYTSSAGIGGYTLSSPKVWGEENLYIFVPAFFATTPTRVEILVIDQSGNLAFRERVADYPPGKITASGPSLGDIFGAIWDFVSSPIDFDTSGSGESLEERFGIPQPTLSIVDYRKYRNRPLIIIEDNYRTLAAYRWSPPALNRLWSKLSRKVRFRSSPAVFANGLMGVGEKNGTMNFFDVESGTKLGDPWYKSDKPILAPPSSIARHVYFTSDNKLIALESNSELWKKSNLLGRSLCSPTLSANYIYVSTVNGFYTFTPNMQNPVRNRSVSGGVSSPSIAKDGTVYVMDTKNTLWAFGGPRIFPAKLIHKIKKKASSSRPKKSTKRKRKKTVVRSRRSKK